MHTTPRPLIVPLFSPSPLFFIHRLILAQSCMSACVILEKNISLRTNLNERVRKSVEIVEKSTRVSFITIQK